MCLLLALAALFPRLTIAYLWIFGNGYLSRAIDPWYWALLGFLFMPLTTLSLAYATNTLGAAGQVPPMGWVLVAIAALLDLGILGGGSRHRRRRRER